MHAALPLRQFMATAQRINLGQQRRDGRESGIVDGVKVKIRRVKRKHFCLRAALRRGLGSQRVQDVEQTLVGQVSKLAESAVPGFVGRNLRTGQPAAIGGAEQVVLKAYRPVKIRLVKACAAQGSETSTKQSGGVAWERFYHGGFAQVDGAQEKLKRKPFDGLE